MQAKRKFIRFSLILGVVFISAGLLVYPIWSDLHAYVGGSIPLLQLLIVAGGAYIGYCYYLLKSSTPIEERSRFPVAVMVISDVAMFPVFSMSVR